MIHFFKRNKVLAAAVLSVCALPASLVGTPAALADNITLQDDTQTKIELSKPAERIVSLAPHLTELLFSVNAGSKIIASVDYANYPEAAKKIPSLGNFTKLSAEAIIAYKPDLVIAWESGNDPRVVTQLRQLHIPVYVQAGENMDLLAREIRQLGILTGNPYEAEKLARETEEEIHKLKATYAQKTPVRVFYQVWNSPMMTVNDEQQIGKIIHFCGGENVFGKATILAPQVSIESVLAADPDVIIASGMDQSRPEWLDEWKKWPQLRAVKNNTLFFIEPDLVQRFTLRSLQGAHKVCEFLDAARAKKALNASP
ncbi:MAG TPA: cobalamin-binding protein [Pseudomonadales bacterium]|nr:cobalamin-binding protein [Pseudomonadales bacterium]